MIYLKISTLVKYGLTFFVKININKKIPSFTCFKAMFPSVHNKNDEYFILKYQI